MNNAKLKRKIPILVIIVFFIIMMIIAGKWDLSISQTMINYNSWLGIVFQTVGMFPLYLILMLSGEIILAVGLRINNHLIQTGWIGIGIIGSFWPLERFINSTEHYLLTTWENIQLKRPIGLSNNDGHSIMISLGFTLMVSMGVYIILTALFQHCLHRQTDQQLRSLLITALGASLTVILAVTANVSLKLIWGRVRPYQLNITRTNFTPWFQINGMNGFRSFPSGHAMAATLLVLLSWFTSGKKRYYFWIIGMSYAVIVGISRVIIGAHFTGDVVFSIFLTWSIIKLMAWLGRNDICNLKLKVWQWTKSLM